MSRDDFKSYEVTLKVLTPIHIGSGTEGDINKLEYIYDKKNKEVHIVDQKKWISHLTRRNGIESYINYVNNAIGSNHKNNMDLLAYITKNCRISPNMLKDFYKLSFKLDATEHNLNDISLFMRNGNGDIYIPGSSIKGAIRNYILADSIYLKNLNDEYTKKLINSKGKYDYKNITKEIDKAIFKDDKGKFRPIGIQISDSYKSNNVKTTLLQDLDYNINKGEIKKIPKFREYIMEGSEFTFSIKVDKVFSKKYEIEDLEDVVSMISSGNINMFENGVFSHIKYINEVIPTDRNNFIILGGNTGFHQKTIVNHIVEGRRELLEVTKNILHKKDNHKILSHKNDKFFSPRVINLVDVEGKKRMSGFGELYYKEV